MTRFLSSLPLLIALGFSAPAVFAQTSDTSEAPAETPGVETQLSLGEDADKDPEIGQPFTKEEIGAWELRCIKFEDGTEPCQMYQLMDDGQGAPIAEISLFRLPDGGQAEAGATVIVPLETALTEQLTISIDGGNPRRYPYAFCNPVGCYVRLGLTQADVSAFKRGKAAEITIVPALAPDQSVVLTLSLEGFTASYDKVSVIDR